MRGVLQAICVSAIAALPVHAGSCDASFELLAWSGPVNSDGFAEDDPNDIANYQGSALITAKDIAKAEVTRDVLGSSQVLVQFSDPAAERFEQATAALIGKRIAIVLDGKILRAPTVMDRIAGGQMLIAGGPDEFEAAALKDAFNSCSAEQEKQ